MIAATVPVVHAAGIDWESLLSVVASLVLAALGVTAFVSTRLARNRRELHATAAAITDALAQRLDKVDSHLTDQDRTQVTMGERVSRIEGRLNGAVWSKRPPGPDNS